MAINKAMRAALKALTLLEPDVKKTYKMERQLEKLTARLRGKMSDYNMWDSHFVLENREIPVRVVTPLGLKNGHVLLYFHGGGWVTGGIENYTSVCYQLANATGSVVAFVDYRLAPEHKFPAAAEDCYCVAREFLTGKVPGVLPAMVTLIGDSAGGNLVAAVSLMARDRGEFMPKRQILFYPSTWNDHSDASPFESIRENGTDYLLTSKRIQDMIALYGSGEADLQNPYFAPLLAQDFSNQPRTLIVTAEFCPLRDEGEEYGRKLKEAGGRIRVVRFKNALHSFLMLPPNFEHVRLAHRIINEFLSKEQPHEKQQELEQA